MNILLLCLVCSHPTSNQAFQLHPTRTTTIRRDSSAYYYNYKKYSSSPIPNPISTTTKQPSYYTLLFGEKYGRGAEIYPVTNEIDFKLTDSFANGILPPSVQEVIDKKEDESTTDLEELNQPSIENNNNNDDNTDNDEMKNNNSMTSAINSILRSAAKSQTEKSPLIDSTPLNKRPPFIAFLLLALGLISPKQILIVTFLSAYFIGLGFQASSPKSIDNMNPILWTIPPQGHIPKQLSNPLGNSISNDPNYISWLRIGVVLGYVAPIVYVVTTILNGQQILSETIATNIFLLCCQITTEDVSKKVLTPLPIRVLIPLIYNTVRLGSLYDWVFVCWNDMNQIGKILAVGNFVYWGVNLFLFLIPVATMKYMRAYFYSVEAEEVTVRDGDEDNIGLLGS